MIYLAMSCLQGRTQDAAFADLLAMQPAGIQLTPGNLPSPHFAARIRAFDGDVRRHHGFAWDAYRTPVYDRAGRPLIDDRDRSLHAPRSVPKERRGRPPIPAVEFEAWLPIAVGHDLLIETMVPGFCLGSGRELEQAMEAGLRLAVDVSHLHIQRRAGTLDAATEARVLAYSRVEEIHLSHNDGTRDQHRPIGPDTPYLGWVREQLGRIPVVLESYWHRLSDGQRRQQVDLAVGRN